MKLVAEAEVGGLHEALVRGLAHEAAAPAASRPGGCSSAGPSARWRWRTSGRRGRPAACWPTIIWKMPELTPPAETTSNSFCSDEPALGGDRDGLGDRTRPCVIASMLLTSLSTWPWPGGPTWKMFSQNACEHRLDAPRSRPARRRPWCSAGLPRPPSACAPAARRCSCAPRPAKSARMRVARRRLGGRGVDHDQAGARRGEQAVGAVDDLLDLRRAGDAEEDDVGAARDRRRGCRLLRRRRRAGRRGWRGCGCALKRQRDSPWRAGSSPCRGPSCRCR